ncbi:hypothetical protein ACFQX7_05910 [Luedemannella flava]
MTRRDLLLLPVSVVSVVVGVAAWHDIPVPAGIAIVFGGVYLLVRLLHVVTRRVALRVDAAGVTLGVTPPWPASHTAVVPWEDIKEILVWTQDAGRAKVTYVGLRRRPGSPPLPGSARSGWLKRLNSAFAPGVSPDVVADSRPATFWPLHVPTLRAAVHQFAPTVPVTDQS